MLAECAIAGPTVGVEVDPELEEAMGITVVRMW